MGAGSSEVLPVGDKVLQCWILVAGVGLIRFNHYFGWRFWSRLERSTLARDGWRCQSGDVMKVDPGEGDVSFPGCISANSDYHHQAAQT